VLPLPVHFYLRSGWRVSSNCCKSTENIKTFFRSVNFPDLPHRGKDGNPVITYNRKNEIRCSNSRCNHGGIPPSTRQKDPVCCSQKGSCLRGALQSYGLRPTRTFNSIRTDSVSDTVERHVLDEVRRDCSPSQTTRFCWRTAGSSGTLLTGGFLHDCTGNWEHLNFIFLVYLS